MPGIEVYYKNTKCSTSGSWYEIVSINYEDKLAIVIDCDGEEIVTIPFSMISNLRVKGVNKELA